MYGVINDEKFTGNLVICNVGHLIISGEKRIIIILGVDKARAAEVLLFIWRDWTSFRDRSLYITIHVLDADAG